MISLRRKVQLDAECRTYVVGRGKRTGHEHLTGYRGTDGKRMGFMTSGRPDAVGIPQTMAKYAIDKRARLVIHHNHPRGTSLSLEDLANLGRLPGTMEVNAHGHERQWYCAISRRDRYFERLLLAADEAFHRCLQHVGMTAVPDDLLNHLFNLAFAASGAIRYEHRLDAKQEQLYNALSSGIFQPLHQAVVQAVSLERSRR